MHFTFEVEAILEPRDDTDNPHFRKALKDSRVKEAIGEAIQEYMEQELHMVEIEIHPDPVWDEDAIGGDPDPLDYKYRDDYLDDLGVWEQEQDRNEEPVTVSVEIRPTTTPHIH